MLRYQALCADAITPNIKAVNGKDGMEHIQALSGELRLGVLGVPNAERRLIAAMLRLFRHNPEFRWVYAETSPYHAVVVGSGSEPAGTDDLPRMRVVDDTSDQRVDKPLDAVLFRPINSDQLERWLLDLQRRLSNQADLSRVSKDSPKVPGRASVQSEERAAPSDSRADISAKAADALETRYRLKRWPPQVLMRDNPSRVRMATLLARRALSHTELVTLGRVSIDEARAFISVLQSAAMLVVTNRTSAVVIPRDQATQASMMSRLISAIRSALYPGRPTRVDFGQPIQGPREFKILFTGTVGAGKTTAIGALSETPPIVTDVANTDPRISKLSTTVGLDFGQFTLANGDRVRLFGTPGQERFEFLWGVLSHNALGIVILTDNSRPDPLGDLEVYLRGFSYQLDQLPCTIGVGRTEVHPRPSIDDYADLVARYGRLVPVLPVDVRRKDDVVLLIDSLLAQLEANDLGA